MTTPHALDLVGIAVGGVSRETLIAVAKALSTEVRRLREENGRLRKDAEVGSAIQRAAAELPVGYIVGISIESDAATVELCLPTGHIKSMDADDDNRLAAEINAAIDAARGGK